MVRDGDVFVETDRGSTWVGEIETILELVGGPAWTITYTDWQKQHYPSLDTSDEGLTVDVVDMVNDMLIGDEFLQLLVSLPGDRDDPSSVPPRTGLFVGKLLENLENGLD